MITYTKTKTIPTPKDGFTVRITFEAESDDTTNLTTISSVKLEVKRNNSSYYPSYSSKTCYIRFYCQNESGTYQEIANSKLSDTSSYDLSTGGYKEWLNKTSSSSNMPIIVPHKNDGSQTVRLSFTVDGKRASYYPIASNQNLDFELPTLITLPSNIELKSIEELSPNFVGAKEIINQLSIKNFAFSCIKGDKNLSRAELLYNQVVLGSTTTFEEQEDEKYNFGFSSVSFANTNIKIENGKGTLQVRVYDENGRYYEQDILIDCVAYNSPSIIATSSYIRRNGQATGNIKIRLFVEFTPQITYTNNVGSSITYNNYDNNNPVSSFTYTGLEQPYIIPTSQINIDVDNKTATINDYDPQITTISKSQKYVITVSFTDKIGNTTTQDFIVPIGEYVWCEFPDRVDFKNITIQNQPLLQPYVLWENTSPTSSFGAKTITLNDDVENYKMIEVYHIQTTSRARQDVSKCFNNYGGVDMNITEYGGGRFQRRNVDATGNQMTISANAQITNYGSTSSTNQNENNIPVYVIGYK